MGCTRRNREVLQKCWRGIKGKQASHVLFLGNCLLIRIQTPLSLPVEAGLFYKPWKCSFESQMLLVAELSLFSFTLISKLQNALLLHSAAQTLTTRGSCSISCVMNRLQAPHSLASDNTSFLRSINWSLTWLSLFRDLQKVLTQPRSSESKHCCWAEWVLGDLVFFLQNVSWLTLLTGEV